MSFTECTESAYFIINQDTDRNFVEELWTAMAGWREEFAFRLKHTGRRLVLEVLLIKALSFVAFHVGLHYIKMNREIYFEIILDELLIACKNRLEGR